MDPQAESTDRDDPVKEYPSLNIIIKHGPSEYKIENLMQDHTIQYLKEQIEELTNVKVARQKLFGIKSKDNQAFNDELTLEETNLIDGMKVMMMGSQESEIRNIEEAGEAANRSKSLLYLDDLDVADEDFDLDSQLPHRPEYMAKICRRVQNYRIKMLNDPRPDKKLLVLDIDYTLFDHRTTAQSASELMRPYLHEFLTAAYQDYDIVIWSATSMKYIEAKMNELGVSTNPNYKISFYLDKAAMISIHSKKYGLLNVKPLAVIWGKFIGQYNPKNTIMFDDTRRNFLMNPQNGLKIKAYRDSFKNRETDEELRHLALYLEKIAKLDDFTFLDHKNWFRYINGHKRHTD